MGRHKDKDRHLPQRMRKKGRAFYHVATIDKKERWTPLGSDYARALMKWRDLEGLSEGAETIAKMLDNALCIMAATIKPSTYREFARACNRLKIAFKGFAPEDVEPVHIGQYLERRCDDEGKPAPVAANREIAFFSSSWDLARRRGWIKLPNPCAGIERNREKQRKRVAKPGEIKALLFDENGQARDCIEADMVELTLRTGIREADMLHLKLTQLEEEGIRVKPRKTDASTEVEQVFEWDPDLKALMDRVKARRRRVGSFYLFGTTRGPRAGQPYTSPSFYKVWKPYFEICGVTGLTWHDLRRTAINAEEKLKGKDAAQKLAAHSSVTTTEGYLASVGAIKIRPLPIEYGK